MTNEQLRKIFNIPERDLLKFLLAKVNLTEKEKAVIDNCLLKGYTEERAAEVLDMSRNGLQKIKKQAYTKLNQVWSNDRIVRIILEETKYGLFFMLFVGFCKYK